MREPFVLIYTENGEPKTKKFSDHDDLTRFIKQDGIEYKSSEWPEWAKKKRKKKG